VFDQLRAFGGYAFPKSHTAAFAVIVYQSAWLKCYYPAAFFVRCSTPNPWGFGLHPFSSATPNGMACRSSRLTLHGARRAARSKRAASGWD